MTNTSHIGLFIGMTVLLLPLLVMAQNPFEYIPLSNTVVTSASNAVDIIVEPETHTPSFYQGQAEPVSGSRVKLVALPHAEIMADSLTYRWSLNGSYISNTATADNQSIMVNLPVGQNATVKVEVFASTGEISATKTENIPLSSMQLAFYEDNPLRGLNQITIGSELIMVGEEIAVTAVPYFSNPTEISRDIKTIWKINNQIQSTENPWKLNLLREELTKDELIDFTLQNHRTLESAKKSFILKL